MKASSVMVNFMGKARACIVMEQSTRVSGRKIKDMEREKRHGQMVDNMRVITSRERERDQANTGILEQPTMDNRRTITGMATEFKYGLMIANMRASG